MRSKYITTFGLAAGGFLMVAFAALPVHATDNGNSNTYPSNTTTEASHQAVTFSTKDYQKQTSESSKQVQYSKVDDHIATTNVTAPGNNNPCDTCNTTGGGNVSTTEADHSAVNKASNDYQKQTSEKDKQAQFAAVNDHVATQTNNGDGHNGCGTCQNDHGSSTSTQADHQAVAFNAKDYQNNTYVKSNQDQLAKVDDHIRTVNVTAPSHSYNGCNTCDNNYGGGSFNTTEADHHALYTNTNDYVNQTSLKDKEVQFAFVNDHIATNVNNGGNTYYNNCGTCHNSFPGTSSSTEADHQAVNFAAKDYAAETFMESHQAQFAKVDDHISTVNFTGGNHNYGNNYGGCDTCYVQPQHNPCDTCYVVPQHNPCDTCSYGNQGYIAPSFNSTQADHHAVAYNLNDYQKQTSVSDQQVQFAAVNDHLLTQNNAFGGGYWNPGSFTQADHQALSFASKDYVAQTSESALQMQFAQVNDSLRNLNFSGNGAFNSTVADHNALSFGINAYNNQTFVASKEVAFSFVNDHLFTGTNMGGYGMGYGSNNNCTPCYTPSYSPCYQPCNVSFPSLGFHNAISNNINVNVAVNVQVNLALAVSISNSLNFMNNMQYMYV